MRVVLLCTALLLSCTSALAFDRKYMSEGERVMPIPIEYFRWWKEVEQCSGIKKSMNIAFYTVPGSGFYSSRLSAIELAGIFVPDTLKNGKIREKIYIAHDYAMIPWLVKHEMLHSFLQEVPRDTTLKDPWHPPLYFAEKCKLLPGLQRTTK